MPLTKPAVTGYFNVRLLGGDQEPYITLSATPGGSVLWAFLLNDQRTYEECFDALTVFLDAELERAFEPTYDSSIPDATVTYNLLFFIPDVLLAAAAAVTAPTVTWDQVRDRLERMQFELDRLRYLFEQGRIQDA